MLQIPFRHPGQRRIGSVGIDQSSLQVLVERNVRESQGQNQPKIPTPERLPASFDLPQNDMTDESFVDSMPTGKQQSTRGSSLFPIPLVVVKPE